MDASPGVLTLKAVRRMAHTSTSARRRHGGKPTADSTAFSDIQECEKDSDAYHMLLNAHALAINSLDCLERTCNALPAIANDPRAGIPITFLLRPTMELAARIWSISAPNNTRRQRIDSAVSQFLYSARNKQSITSSMKTASPTQARKMAEHTAPFEDALQRYQASSKGPNQGDSGNPTVLANGLFSDDGIYEMLGNFFGTGDSVEIDPQQFSRMKSAMGNQFVHNDPIFLASFLALGGDDGLRDFDKAGIGFPFAENLIVGSVAAAMYFGWDDEKYRVATVKHFNTAANNSLQTVEPLDG